MKESRCESLDTESLLQMVVSSEPPVRVILDLGAQVLEWKNEAVVSEWLLRVPEAQAAIFFNNQNDLSILTRDSLIEPLMISSFAKRMDECLVYLDEALTRGTDLKLPTNYRAAVTLGPELTKDRLVQACMRMRKLGKGQSVMFCGPIEVERKILRCSGRFRYEDITVRYGLEKRRSEEQSLLYDGQEIPLSKRETRLNAMRAKCREFEVLSFNNATLREEQERELSPDNEQERQVEHPSALESCNHSVHQDVKSFARHGILDRDSVAFQPAFKLFSNKSAMECLETEAWLVIADFARTVHASANQHLDSFLRPVHWVVSGRHRNPSDYVLVSPFEAYELLPSIRQYKAVTLHVYSPRVSMSLRTLEDLSFCAVPALPTY